jgi:hypothetical protein
MRRSGLTPSITYQETTGRYRGPGGQFVSGAVVRAELDAFLDRTEKDILAVTEALRAGRISLSDWQLAMEKAVKGVHVASAALAKGGWAQVTQADLGRAGQKIRAQYGYLRNFAADIASGKQRLDGTLARRAALYVQAGRNTYHAVEQREMRARGMVEERNLLSPGDSCPGCLAADALGWVELGTLPEIGTRDCTMNCRCRIAYR